MTTETTSTTRGRRGVGRRLRMLALGTAVAGVATLGIVAPAQAATAGALPSSGLFLQRWAAAHMSDGKTLTRDQAIAVATRYDVVIGSKSQFTSYIADMKAAKPNLLLLVYLNGSHIDAVQAETVTNEAMYAHDLYGNRIRDRKFGNYLMDVSNADWRIAAAQRCASFLQLSGYDACYADELGVSAINPNISTAVAINPATGTEWTKKDYIAATVGLATEMRNRNPGIVVAGNGLGGGKQYFSYSSPLLGALDAGHSETWLRGGGNAIDAYESEADWKSDVDMLVDAGQRQSPVLAMVKVWVKTATQAQLDSWHKYAVASFLLGTDGTSYFTFTSRRTFAEATDDHPWDRVDVGQPTGPYAKTGGLYQRQFTAGLAAVNPTTAPVTVTLDRNYVDLGGASHPAGSQFTLAPNTGDVLRTP